MSDALALRYRPRTFADVAGQAHVVGALYRMAYLDNLPDALIFQGPRGTGKTTTARIISAAANCEQPPGKPDEWPCGICASCKAIADETSLDVMEIDAASNGRVDEIRRIRDLVQYQAMGKRHMVLLDEAQSMSRDAHNAVLKVLEEPPPDTIFALLTTEPNKIPKTVFSRCMRFNFRRLTAPVIAARLTVICQQEGIAVQPELLFTLSERADGALRDAVMLLDQAVRAGVYDMERYQAVMGELDYGPALLAAMVSGKPEQLYALLDAALIETGDFDLISGGIVACLRDVLVLLGGGVIAAQGQGLAMRTHLAGQLDAPRVVAAMRVLWDLRTKAARTDPRSSLELAALMCLEKLGRTA